MQHCRALASRYKVPDFIEIRDALPVTATGKLMRRELKRLAGELRIGATHEPRTHGAAGARRTSAAR